MEFAWFNSSGLMSNMSVSTLVTRGISMSIRKHSMQHIITRAALDAFTGGMMTSASHQTSQTESFVLIVRNSHRIGGY